MTSALSRLALFATLLLAYGTAHSGSPAGVLRLQPSTLIDPAGFGRPMVAATIFTPHGWTVEGGVDWGQQHRCTNGYAIRWQAEAPDGRSAMAILPAQPWEWNQYQAPTQPGCAVARIQTIEGYLKAMVAEVFEGGRILEIRPRPDIAAQRAQQNGVQDDGFQRIETQVRSAEALVEFRKNGELMRGLLVGLVTFTHMRTGSPALGSVVENFMGYAEPPFAAYGPAATFAPAVFEAMRRSLVANPPWRQLIAQHLNTMNGIARQGIMARAEIQRQTANDIAAMQQQAWNAQQQSADARAHDFIQAIRDVQTYQDPSVAGGQVELSNLYNQAWRLADGTYVLTDDPSFQPYAVFGIEGQQLAAAR